MNGFIFVSDYVVVEKKDGKQVGGTVMFSTPDHITLWTDGKERVQFMASEVECVMDDTASVIWPPEARVA